MPLSPNINNREMDKFEWDNTLGTYVKIKGNFNSIPSGLMNGFRITTMDIPATGSIALPVTPLVNRNAISIHNLSDTEIVYIGDTNVTADAEIGLTSGWEVDPNGNFNLDITDNIILYGRTASTTVRVKIIELS